MKTYKAVSWDGDTLFISAWTYTEAQEKAFDAFDGNLKELEEA